MNGSEINLYYEFEALFIYQSLIQSTKDQFYVRRRYVETVLYKHATFIELDIFIEDLYFDQFYYNFKNYFIIIYFSFD